MVICTIENLVFQCEIKKEINENKCEQLVYSFGHQEDGNTCCIIFYGWKPHLDIDLTELNKKINEPIGDVFIDLVETINEVINEQKPKEKQYRIIDHLEVIEGIPFVGYHTRKHTFGRVWLKNHKDINQVRKICNEMDINIYEAHLSPDIIFMTDLGLRTMIFVHFNALISDHRKTKCKHEYYIDCKVLSPNEFASETKDGLRNGNLRVYWGTSPFVNCEEGGSKTESFSENGKILIDKWITQMTFQEYNDKLFLDIDRLQRIIEKYNLNPGRGIRENTQFQTQMMTQISQMNINKIFEKEIYDWNEEIEFDSFNEEVEVTQELINKNEKFSSLQINEKEKEEITFKQSSEDDSKMECEEQDKTNGFGDLEIELDGSIQFHQSLDESIDSSERMEIEEGEDENQTSGIELLSQISCTNFQIQRNNNKIFTQTLQNKGHNFFDENKSIEESVQQGNKTLQINLLEKNNRLINQEVLFEENKPKSSDTLEINYKTNENVIVFDSPPSLFEIQQEIKYHKINIYHEGIIIPKINEINESTYPIHCICTIPPPSFMDVIQSLKTQNNDNEYIVNQEKKLNDPYSYFMINRINNPLISKNSCIISIQLLFHRIDESTGKYQNSKHDSVEGIIVYQSFRNKTLFYLIHTDLEAIKYLHNIYKTLKTIDIICHNELSLFNSLIKIINDEDADMIIAEDCSFTIQFINERYKLYKQGSFNDKINRLQNGKGIKGRLVLDMWHIYKECSKFSNYETDYIAKQVFNVSLPNVNYLCYNAPEQLLNSFLRFHCCLLLLDYFGYINRIREFAQFHSCPLKGEIERGSQYKVECYLKRVSKSEFKLFSPSDNQLNSSRATDCVALVMEPQSGFHSNPVIVLDFLSMYPTTAIAYNICYSTCLGYVDDINIERKIGPMTYSFEKENLHTLKGNIHVVANGIMFVDACVRKGILPIMLEEMLSTRQHIKERMKMFTKGSEAYKKCFLQQLALKLLCNVVYGYTGAGLSGRMPCNEIADAIVETARQTLEKAINFAERKFGGKVIYSDTDSLFVEMEGKTIEESFEVGKQLCEEFNKTIPPPMKLQLEKVYWPLVTVTKKRYFGMKYEKCETKPTLEAKGLEAVRKDSCEVVRGMMASVMKYLLNKDIEGMKQYLEINWEMIQKGEGFIDDFVISRPYRRHYAEGRKPPIGTKVVLKERERDNTFYFQYGQRVKYVVVRTSSGKLCDSAVSPQFAASEQMIIDSDYYINKQINNALQRILLPCGIDINKWYNTSLTTILFEGRKDKKVRLEDYYLIHKCIRCNKKIIGESYLCKTCSYDKRIVIAECQLHIKEMEQRLIDMKKRCLYCQLQYPFECISTQCPISFKLIKEESEYRNFLKDVMKNNETTIISDYEIEQDGMVI
ncbi:DNA polymerase zeta catalytic subunit, putative [Entamoeba histolytica HM-1:IMSS-B]|uniref:DNA polymerase n=5 Tax=Entamoeba histolytica TaxID=5759 RepID=C4LTZ7_ENTH1|nr:DNA polymerase zeta catalytic subunit, putative [Entamoeba histolytica HM-1:IMSS]EMH77373.1 DNA polymerase zeta catalytic subunit, putative [Entamoeba histolytica HM-1:IMSS-B]EMS14261.1 DNA polymerase zeta catalytic subunit, putative [Entamoeba histolytica HM-3:IMSS]ENY65837.1 DNA polymerase zeta catalytic subunit, putative [Entamoeba histolytica HM-1:IMSS-A]GAT92060.1 DNA polymerase zeta catalytic subunit putative [Entamoeba histolytica]EAL51383.1 DNA polymerase zeta catalytic subunit, put|eukprot:XP_656768.1 DNA polymerase zeta catalytic subunit, putative [Entamoeba histolytica HM-1:IMSS]